jgi:hypothetical protein
MVNGFMTFLLISSVLFAKFLPSHKINFFFIAIGVPGIIGPLLGFLIHKYHTK